MYYYLEQINCWLWWWKKFPKPVSIWCYYLQEYISAFWLFINWQGIMI